MNCFVCEKGVMKPFFVKRYRNRRESDEFVRCDRCGMVINKTVYNMSPDDWKSLNYETHSSYQGTEEDADDPKWLLRLNAQADVISGLFAIGVFHEDDRTVDYGCGDGKLSQYVNTAYEKRTGKKPDGLLLGKYDRYMASNGDVSCYSDGEIKRGTFDVAVSCSVLEHLIGMDQIDSFFSLSKPEGTICLHTLVCEAVPCDPEWFYIDPEVHCTIWTNAAMAEIYNRYGYKGCAYHLESQMWFFFGSELKFRKLVEQKDKIEGTWVFSDKFVDYWKQKPYRE